MAYKACNFRFAPDVVEHLDELCKASDTSRTEYDSYQGNPELQKLLSQMQDMRKQLEALTVGKK